MHYCHVVFQFNVSAFIDYRPKIIWADTPRLMIFIRLVHMYISVYVSCILFILINEKRIVSSYRSRLYAIFEISNRDSVMPFFHSSSCHSSIHRCPLVYTIDDDRRLIIPAWHKMQVFSSVSSNRRAQILTHPLRADLQRTRSSFDDFTVKKIIIIKSAIRRIFTRCSTTTMRNVRMHF